MMMEVRKMVFASFGGDLMEVFKLQKSGSHSKLRANDGFDKSS